MARHVVISLTRQTLQLCTGARLLQEYGVSTSRYGPGEICGSQCTPRGRHVIRACIGAGLPPGAVLVGRRYTGEIYDAQLAARYPGRDWILTRILWLCGQEPGRNRFGNVDSMRRYIYIHGTPDSEPLWVPQSHGCIRMRNEDIMDLFEQVGPGTEVDIRP